MVNEEMMKQMPHLMGQGVGMMNHPVTQGAMVAASGLAAGRALLGPAIFRNPLVILAGGIAAGVAIGYLLHKHEKDVVLGLSKLTGMGKDFVLQQRENLDDLMAEAKEQEAAPAEAATTATTTPPSPAAETPA